MVFVALFHNISFWFPILWFASIGPNHFAFPPLMSNCAVWMFLVTFRSPNLPFATHYLQHFQSHSLPLTRCLRRSCKPNTCYLRAANIPPTCCLDGICACCLIPLHVYPLLILSRLQYYLCIPIFNLCTASRSLFACAYINHLPTHCL